MASCSVELLGNTRAEQTAERWAVASAASMAPTKVATMVGQMVEQTVETTAFPLGAASVGSWAPKRVGKKVETSVA